MELKWNQSESALETDTYWNEKDRYHVPFTA
jgi:hypothetical protein